MNRNLGWIVAAALMVVAVTAGFQGGTKVGVVDASKVFEGSDYYKTQVDAIKAFGQARQDMFQFVDTYRTFTPEQATRFHDLSLKDSPTAADKAELDTIKKAVQQADARLKELQQKQNPTPSESTELQDLSRRVQTTTDTAQSWSRDAQEEFTGKQQEVQKTGMQKVRDAIKQAASAQGYTLVFTADDAPYGANDLTDAALKAMNKK